MDETKFGMKIAYQSVKEEMETIVAVMQCQQSNNSLPANK